MRVSHVTACYAPADGVGSTLREKLEASRAWGDEVRLFVEAGAPPVPEVHRELATHLDLASLVDERAGGPSVGFFGADLTIFQFLHPYPLLRASLLVDRGALAFEFPGFTPVGFYRHEDHFRRLQQDLDGILPYLDHADAVLVHSRSMGEEVRALRPSVGPKLRVLRLGVDSDRLEERDPGRVAAWLPPADPALLYVGRMAGNKRVDLLVEAFARVVARRPGARLRIVGDGESPPYDRYRREVEARARALGVRDRIDFLGKVPDRDLADLYGASDLFVTASQHEGFCLPAAEALYCGLPVVAFASTALPEVVEDAGILAEPSDEPGSLAQAVERALGSLPHLRERAAERGVTYGRPAFRRRYREFCEDLVAGAGVRPSGRTHLLEALKDTPVHYQDRCDWPLVGGLVSRIRRRITLHFEKFYVRRMHRLQGLFNGLLLARVAELEARLAELESERSRSGRGEGR